MRRVAPGLACLAIVVCSAVTSAQQPNIVSIQRIRAALLKPPPKLIPVYRQPDFSVHIRERGPFDDLFEVPLWDTPPTFTMAPSMLAPIEGVPKSTPALFQIGVDPGGLVRSATKKAQARSARAQTERAIVQYCGAQPDRGLSIPLCWAYSSQTP
jgi:hypothetical protein